MHTWIEQIKADKRWPLGLSGVCWILIISILIAGVFNIKTARELPHPNLKYLPIKTVTLPNIADWHLFGIYEGRVAAIPTTRLALKLEGVALNVAKPQLSYAIITAPGQTAKVYRIGETLPGDAILHQILKDQVIISVAGELQSLKLPMEQL